MNSSNPFFPLPQIILQVQNLRHGKFSWVTYPESNGYFFGKGHLQFSLLPAQQWVQEKLGRQCYRWKKILKKKHTPHTSTKMLDSEILHMWENFKLSSMNRYGWCLKYLPHLLVIEGNSLKHRRAPRARDPLHRLGGRDHKHIWDVPAGERGKAGLLQTWTTL